MRRLDHTAPFDQEFDGGPDADLSSDLTEEFWGTSPNWHDRTASTPRISKRSARRSSAADDTTGAIRAIRDGVSAFRPRQVDMRDTTGEMRRTRSHGVVGHATAETERVAADERSIGDLASGAFDHVRHAAPASDHDVDLSPVGAARTTRVGLGAVDPLLARLGALLLIGALLVPLAMALRPSRADGDTVRIDAPNEIGPESAGPLSADTTPTPQPSVVNSAAAVTDDANEAGTVATTAQPAPTVAATDTTVEVESSPGTTTATATTAPADSQSEDAALADVTETTSAGIARAATVESPAVRVVPECPQTYTAGAGDSWYRIAEEAGVTPTALLTENRSTLDSVIFPGDEICLPAGATIPTQPTTTTTAPTTTEPATTTTTAPTVTVPSSTPATVEEVKQMIRDTWPEDQHEMALFIAKRESNFDPTADNNFCCFGVFQIYWNVHKSWLDDFGIYSSSDLFDAEKNIAAAYALYERSGGWGPWGF